MRFYNVIICALACLTLSLKAQVSVQWATPFNGTGNNADAGNKVAIDASGNVYTTGYTSNGANHDYITIKYNSAGVQQWTATYNGPANSDDRAIGVKVDASGNVYVAGWSYGTVGSQDFATIKYNSAGAQQWVSRYNGPGSNSDLANAMYLDASGNVYVTGMVYGGASAGDYAAVKYNNAGVQQWAVTYTGAGANFDSPSSITVDATGNVYVTGNVVNANGDCVTVKYNSSGAQQWVATYAGSGNGNDIGRAVEVDGSGNVYVFGTAVLTNTDYITIKYNSSGTQQWATAFNGASSSTDNGTAMTLDGSGNIFVTGYSFTTGSGYDIATVKYNNSGAQQWVRTYNGTANTTDLPNAVLTDAAGNCYLVGSVTNAGTSNDWITMKYNTAGTQLWATSYNGSANTNDYARSLAVDADGCVYVVGDITETTQNILTLKYAENGAALNFDGSNDYITVPAAASLTLGNTATVEGKFKCDVGGQRQFVNVIGTPGGYDIGLLSSGKFYFNVYHGSWLNFAWTAGPNFDDNLWHHFAVVSTGNTTRAYVDGVLAGTVTGTAPLNTGSTSLNIGRH